MASWRDLMNYSRGHINSMICLLNLLMHRRFSFRMMSRGKVDTMINWSDLGTDLLEHVTSFLPLCDQHRFSAVCHDWRIVVKQKRHPPAPQIPWLVLGEDQQTKKRNFYNLSDDRRYSIDIPELYGHYICGSSFGWLITVDKNINGRVINSFTRDFYDLPSYPPYGGDGNPITHTEESIFYCNGNQLGYTFSELQTMIVRKAVLSHDPRKKSGFTVIIIFGACNTLGMWRLGEKSWTLINPKCRFMDSVSFMDVICFEGKLYGVSQRNNLYAVDLDSEHKITLINPSASLMRVPAWSYLADFKGKFLLILRFKKDYNKPTKKFRVYEVDVKKGIYCEWEKIFDHAIFVGNNSTIVIDRTKVRGCAKNSIYFTDMCESYYWQNYGHDVGLYDMDRHAVRPYRPRDDVLYPRQAALTWLTPNV